MLNPNNIRIILEDLKADDPPYPVIVDAGVGTASDVAIAMELGCDGVLLNTGIAGAADPLRMARAMRLAVEAGWLAAGAGRISTEALCHGFEPHARNRGSELRRRPAGRFPLKAGDDGMSELDPPRSLDPAAPSRAGCRRMRSASSSSRWPMRWPGRSRPERT